VRVPRSLAQARPGQQVRHARVARDTCGPVRLGGTLPGFQFLGAFVQIAGGLDQPGRLIGSLRGTHVDCLDKEKGTAGNGKWAEGGKRFHRISSENRVHQSETADPCHGSGTIRQWMIAGESTFPWTVMVSPRARSATVCENSQ